MQFLKKTAFINRKKELQFLKDWIEQEPENILFIHGPKSSGKTTLIYKLLADYIDAGKYHVKHFNLREILIVNYRDFIQAFFGIDYSKSKEDVKEKREYDLKVFKLSTEVLKGLETKELDPFAVMKKELEKLANKGVNPLIIIDELQALENIYINGQRELIKELFNFFVSITKESHLCHVIISGSDGYFIEKVYNDSKLKKTSIFMEVDYLTKKDVGYWLDNLEKESAITRFVLTDSQKKRIWESFGGSCWEISTFLGDLFHVVDNAKISNKNFESALKKKLVTVRSMFVEYALLYKQKIKLFIIMNKSFQLKGYFTFSDLEELINKELYTIDSLKEELNELVRKNFLYYDPTQALYNPQGQSMKTGLEMFVKRKGGLKL